MDEQEDWTCGKGLAASAIVPERVGAVMAAMAEVLQVHMEALDLKDDDAKPEHDAYHRVSRQLGQIASRLDTLALEMAAYRDLPMGRHDVESMSRPIVRGSFEAFVARKRELLALLRETDEEDREMLEQMNG